MAVRATLPEVEATADQHPDHCREPQILEAAGAPACPARWRPGGRHANCRAVTATVTVLSVCVRPIR